MGRSILDMGEVGDGKTVSRKWEELGKEGGEELVGELGGLEEAGGVAEAELEEDEDGEEVVGLLDGGEVGMGLEVGEEGGDCLLGFVIGSVVGLDGDAVGGVEEEEATVGAETEGVEMGGGEAHGGVDGVNGGVFGGMGRKGYFLGKGGLDGLTFADEADETAEGFGFGIVFLHVGFGLLAILGEGGGDVEGGVEVGSYVGGGFAFGF